MLKIQDSERAQWISLAKHKVVSMTTTKAVDNRLSSAWFQSPCHNRPLISWVGSLRNLDSRDSGWFSQLTPKKLREQVLCQQFANGPWHKACSLNVAMPRPWAPGWRMPSLKSETRNCRSELETLTSPWSPWFKAIVFAKLNCLIHVVTSSQNKLSTKGTHDMPQRFSMLPSFAPKSNEYKELRERIQRDRQRGADQL